MLGFIARRLVMLIGTLLVSSFVIYSALYLAPGNPIAALTGNRTPSPEAIATLNERYHLNDPFLLRYLRWLGSALHGDLGVSIPLHQDVSTIITERVGVTASLVLYAAIIIAILGIGAGILSALRPGAIDTTVIVLSTMLAAIPSFIAAIVLLLVFSVQLGWFPTYGTGEGLIGRIEHLTLPAIALAAASIAIVARVTRASVRAEAGREHVQTAVSRGIPRHLIIRRHILRNAAIPITTVTGLSIAALIALSAVVERAFALNGLGSYLIQAALSKDLAVVQGIALVLVFAFVITNTLIDILYALLDPRVQLGSRAE